MSRFAKSGRDRSTTTGSRSWAHKPVALYISAVAALAILLSIQTWQGGLGLDAYAHLAVFRELSAHPLDPTNPYVAGTDPAHYFSPYSVGLGVVGWFTRMEPVAMLHLGAVLNLALLTTGLWLFSRSFSPSQWTPHLALFYTLFAWGFASWHSSGFFHLGVIGFGLGYPSIFASGLALVTLAGLCRYFSSPGWTLAALLGVAVAIIVLSHLFTTLWFVIAALAITAAQPMKVLRRAAGGLLGIAAIAVVVTLLWPYYSIVEIAFEASTRSAVHGDLYRDVLRQSFLFIPGLVALAYRAHRRLRDPLVLMFIGGVIVYFVGYAATSHGLGRIIPLIALSTHVALADLCACWFANWEKRRTALAVIVVVGVIGMVGSTQGLIWMVPRSFLPTSIVRSNRPGGAIAPYRSLEDVLSATDIALGSPLMNRVVPAFAGRVVVPGHLTPLLADREERERAVEAFFSDDGTADERNSIAANWSVTHVVVEPEDLSLFPWLERDYGVVALSDAYVVFLVDAGRNGG